MTEKTKRPLYKYIIHHKNYLKIENYVQHSGYTNSLLLLLAAHNLNLVKRGFFFFFPLQSEL